MISTARKFCDAPEYNVDKVKKLLTTLNVPLLQQELVGNILDKITMQLPSVLNPSDILKSLYLGRKEDTVLKLSKHSLSVLFTVFKGISYFNKDNQRYIRHLPVFTTISGKNVTLSSASLILIWNDREACCTGRDQWIKHISADVVFLDPRAPWACIEHEIINNLRINQINRYDIYCDFIFPSFHLLDPDVQNNHLCFIKTEIYPHCEHTLSHSNNYSKIQKIKSFISAFRNLRCISDSSGKLRSIDSFNDHNDMLFQTFCSESHFLPDSFKEEEWYDFLVYFGLKTVPTVDEFITYCKRLPNMGNADAIKIASSVLLSALFFSPKTDDNKYKSIQSPKYICDIPIAVVEEIPDLNSIKAQNMGEHIVKCGNNIVYLTRLSGSSTVDNKHLLWTIRPLISLPHDPDSQRMKDFEIVESPSVNDVIANLLSLSTTAFANNSRFERHNTGPLADKGSLLPAIVVSMLKYIQKQLNEPENSLEHTFKKHKLSTINFLPVKLPTNSKEYALVKPIQVIYTIPQFIEPLPTQTSPIASFYPFLHPLIEEAYGVFDVLSHVGVQSSITFSHIQLILQLAKSKCHDNVVDINTIHVVVKIVDELISLLHQNKDNKGNIAQSLKPLYLLSQDNKLIDCSNLIVFDIVGFHQFPLPDSYAYLNPLKDDKIVRSKLLLELLPKELGLKSLKSMLEYEIIDYTQAEEVYQNVSIIGDILLSEEFKLGIELLGRCYSNDDNVHNSVTNVLEKFQCGVTIQHLSNLEVKPKIKIGYETVPLDNTITHWRFFLQKYADQKWILSLKNTSDNYPSSIYSNLAKQLCSRLKLNSISCFEGNSDDDLLDLTEFMSLMLKCQSISKVSEVIHKNIPSYFTSDIDMSCLFNDYIDPNLGDTIAEYWHFRLDQNILNLFWPEEWVGYETERGDIVYAQILYEIIQDSSMSVVNNEQKMMQRKFLIEIGKDEPIEVDVLELYKFFQNDAVDNQDTTSTDMKVYDGPENSIQPQQEIDFDAIRAAVKAAFALPVEKQKKAIKRLYLKYHPDKNSSSNATAEFQFLKKEIKRVEEAHTENTDGTQAYSRPHPNWGNCYSQWNQTASSHTKFKSAGRQSSAWNIPNPHKDLREAQVWIKQAYYDYKALCVLKTASEIDNEVAAATCFMCHEVAEKSLKAGMYAKCGISPESLSKHNVIILARALVQLQCPVEVIDARSLEGFYLESRFPNRYSPSAAPGDKIDSLTAQNAFEAATRIFEVMKKVIADDT